MKEPKRAQRRQSKNASFSHFIIFHVTREFLRFSNCYGLPLISKLMSCALFWQLSCNLLLCTQIGLISDYLNEARGYKMLQVLSRVAAVSECELYCRIDSEGWNGGMVRKYYLISLI